MHAYFHRPSRMVHAPVQEDEGLCCKLMNFDRGAARRASRRHRARVGHLCPLFAPLAGPFQPASG